MNYRHAFHAGNHADVLKHIVLLGLIDALQRKPTPYFVLDTHAGYGDYDLGSVAARRTGEADGGIARVLRDARGAPAAVRRYIDAVRAAGADPKHYPGSPRLAAQTLREHDRLALCEVDAEAVAALKQGVGRDHRVAVHARDGYGALAALLPPKEKRGLVLIDPPYEAQLDEFDAVLAALGAGLARWPGGIYALWYPVKLRRSLARPLRRIAALPARSVLQVELTVRPPDSPLRMNGSGMLILNPPWQYEQELQAMLPWLVRVLEEERGDSKLEWLKREP